MDERCWYAGTPEQDRFRGNEPGYVLDVRIAGPGAVPEVERVALGRYRWSAWRETLSLPTDAQALADRLAALRGEDVLSWSWPAMSACPAGSCCNGAGEARAARCSVISRPAAGAGRGRFRAAGASGYVAEVAAQLQAMQAAPGDEAQAAVASEALRLLRMQREAAAEGGAQ